DPEALLATAKSWTPSPLKSATTTELGKSLRAINDAVCACARLGSAKEKSKATAIRTLIRAALPAMALPPFCLELALITGLSTYVTDWRGSRNFLGSAILQCRLNASVRQCSRECCVIGGQETAVQKIEGEQCMGLRDDVTC